MSEQDENSDGPYGPYRAPPAEQSRWFWTERTFLDLESIEHMYVKDREDEHGRRIEVVLKSGYQTHFSFKTGSKIWDAMRLYREGRP